MNGTNNTDIFEPTLHALIKVFGGLKTDYMALSTFS